MPDAARSSHPGIAQLASYALGKLAGEELYAINAHLNECPTCRKSLKSLPKSPGGTESVSGRETLATVGLLRPAHPAPGNAGQVSDSSAFGATAAYRPESNVPADLANHPKFEILQLLGQGGMGAVYKARHKKMDRFVALKVINAKLLDNPKAVERFQREVKAAAKLEHPNIVRAYDADEAGGTHFLVMEFVEGTNLANYVERKGPLPLAHACHFIRQAALGLEHAHQHGMVHRDIKPHNLMLTVPNPGAHAAGAPVVKVMDFGLALVARETASEAGLTGENALMGTADYIAPEQATDAHKADIRADIYSLGCSLFHLLAGRPPLGGANFTQKLAAHLMGNLPLGDLPAGVPAELGAVLAKMVAKDPGERYQTPREVAQALQPFTKAPAKATPAAPPPARAAVGQECTPWEGLAHAPEKGLVQAARKEEKPGSNRWIRPPGIALLAAGLAAAVIAGIVLFWQSPNGTVRIESDDPAVEIVFDKIGPTIMGADKQPITLRAGAHGVLVKRGDFEFETEKFMVKKDDRITLKVELLTGKIQVLADGRVIGAKELPAVAAAGAGPVGPLPEQANRVEPRQEKMAPVKAAEPPRKEGVNEKAPIQELAKTLTVDLGAGLTMDLVLIPAGRFWMGSPKDEEDRDHEEGPQHEVMISKPFYLGKYEVTRGQFRRFVAATEYQTDAEKAGDKDTWKKNEALTQTDDHPVLYVSWNDAKKFCGWLSEKERKEFRLPTEAEWEYACRAGTTTRFHSGDADSSLKEVARFNSLGTGTVGALAPNGWGLYDMHGNAFEWCEDRYGKYNGDKETDPTGPSEGPSRVNRGGGWSVGPRYCRSAYRYGDSPDYRCYSLGFRLALVPSGK